MVRPLILSACFAVLALASVDARAAERAKDAAAAPPVKLEDANRQQPLESIAEEAEEVGGESDAPDGMERNMDEMIAGENQDGCIGSLAGEEGTGCDE